MAATGGIWVHGELAGDGSLAKLSTEVATLARSLAKESGDAAVTGVVIGADPAGAAAELAKFVPKVLTLAEPLTSDHAAGMIVAQRMAALVEERDPDVILVGAGPEGRDLAGALAALTGRGVLANATAVRGTADGPVATHSVFGGKLITESALTDGRGIITVRPNSVTAEPAASAGTVEAVKVEGSLDQPAVPVVDRIEATSKAASIDDARIIVAGGRGVGGPDGFKLIEDLATVLGGAVGATRAAVDSGWIPYSQQIGQTGKIVKPQLYLAMGISGAIQHKVGMQTASTIIAVNRDPDAPIADFADMIVIGDLVEVGNALLAQLRARTG
jgi:electron transfer flavoprotein alpha subunit